MIKSPSKYTPLFRLKQIKKDNYLSESGQEYDMGETDQLISLKMSVTNDDLYFEAMVRQALSMGYDLENDVLLN